ncbi:PTS cellobiose transporter subunit IIB [Thermoanaerobacterium thermosaccharolyticum]|uniref:PTS cellobiose transporter subunit IIB n=1 Tax=Thermoanaerobacterium thermosaccharolyticum TaxID=1517 RepID=A0A223HXF3_THETR|nr:PTS sugar transporter subunit IIB [Thermoanaerobacterium thermosaccharolyticum]AST57112.1 PTS cellobiose transporter subunit IIB [Thermoanaerobacterium thermosaccharolyticum]
MKKITLICAAGMSTSLMVTKMKEAAKKLGEEVEIRATPESKFEQYENDTDILLLGPQVGFLLNKYKQTYEPKGIKVDVIDSVDYGMMNGEKVLKNALSL